MKLGKHSKAVKRFGSRYGKRTRERLSKVETTSKATHKCPYCNYISAKRVANGIFQCRKCNSKFTGRAYSPVKQKTVKHQKKREVHFEDELFTKKESKKKDNDAEEARQSLKSMEENQDESQEESSMEQE